MGSRINNVTLRIPNIFWLDEYVITIVLIPFSKATKTDGYWFYQFKKNTQTVLIRKSKFWHCQHNNAWEAKYKNTFLVIFVNLYS